MREYEIYQKLQKYGIQTPKYAIFAINEEPYFDTFPAVLKIASDKIIHKSDVGGVRRGIHSLGELQDAKREIIDALQSKGIFLDIQDRFIVEEEIEGEEFYIGGIFDAIFEEVLLFGKGGVLLEIEKDICYIDIEATKEEIIKSFSTTKISKIFPEYRGKRYELNYIIDTIQKFQQFFSKEEIVEFDVNPLIYTPKGLIAVDARVKKGEKKRKQKGKRNYDIFENRSVALFGATDKKEKVGYALAKNTLNANVKIYFVNPKLETLFGKKVYHSTDELPNIDTAIIAISSKYVIELVEELAKKEVKNIIIISAGFAEIGNKEFQEKLTLIARHHNINIIGPNCLGIFNAQLNLNATFATSQIKSGKLALVSQSGAVLSALIDKANRYSIGFSHILSLGNMADVDFSDAIATLNNKEECQYISLYAEGLQNGKEYLRSLRSSQKPILVYKAGKSNEAQKAAFSHTGNISGNYEMFYGLSYAAGAILKEDIDELLFAPSFHRFEDVIILTNAGGPGTILADIVVSHKKHLKKLDSHTIEALSEVLPPTWSHNNPVDIIGDATSNRYKAALDILSTLNALILVIVTPQFMTDGLNIAQVVKEYKNTIPIFFGGKEFEEVFEYLRKEDILFFDDLENVANIL